MNFKIKFIFLLFFLVFEVQLFSQKWYYHSMKGSIEKCDTTSNIAELEKCKQLFDRILVSRPNDSLALYYSVFTNCLKYYYTKTLIYTEEQVIIEKQISLMDSAFVKKNEIRTLKLFYKLLCNGVKVDEQILSEINNLKPQNKESIRVLFLENFALIKANKIKKEELPYTNKIESSQSEELKIGWGKYQILFLKKYFQE